jgi:alpha-aminoadipic semialdehyde synthase
VPPSESKATLWLEGHLFDSGLINHALDIIEQNDCTFEIVECQVRRKQDGIARKSNVIVRIASPDDSSIVRIENQVSSLIEIMQNADCTMKRLDGGRADTIDIKQHSTFVKELPKEEKILVLGSGLVSKSLVEYLGRKDRRQVTVAGAIEEEARSVSQAARNGRYVTMDVQNDMRRVKQMIGESDIVVSLLPASMHPDVADACIDAATDLVTASYESEAMRNLNERAKAEGVRLLNEVGLDPGLDHMSALRIIDDIHSRGGIVKKFTSVCGGLPSPEAADNPLMYKFSWSPMGVLSACKNDAVYRSNNDVIEVDGNYLLREAAPFTDAWPALRLECLPNRNSLLYEDKYGIHGAENIFRGTLRYSGFSGIMSVFQAMGLLEAVDASGMTWSEAIDSLQRKAGFASLGDFLLFCAEGNQESALRAAECLQFLNMDGGVRLSCPDNLVASFCEVLKSKCRYEHNERDMCLMHTSVHAVFGDAVEETHHSSLQIFGDSHHSAMSKTVGYTAAAATDVLLADKARSGGLLLPISKDLYVPILDALATEGVCFKEGVKVSNTNDSKRTVPI